MRKRQSKIERIEKLLKKHGPLGHRLLSPNELVRQDELIRRVETDEVDISKVMASVVDGPGHYTVTGKGQFMDVISTPKHTDDIMDAILGAMEPKMGFQGPFISSLHDLARATPSKIIDVKAEEVKDEPGRELLPGGTDKKIPDKGA